MKLSELALLCMLATTGFGSFAPDRGFLLSLPLWIQWLFMSLLLILPGIGAVVGVLSWRRENQTGCIATAVIVLNILLVVVGAVRLFWFSSTG